jgi:hypothetical protein
MVGTLLPRADERGAGKESSEVIQIAVIASFAPAFGRPTWMKRVWGYFQEKI